VRVAQEYDVERIRTRRGDVVVGYAPYPIRSRLLELATQKVNSIRESDSALEEVLTNLLVDLADKADQLAQGEDIPRLLTGHFSVRGAVTGTERNVMLGRDVLVSLHLLADTRWDYVALGHIHKHQNLTAGREGVPPVIYSGSLERIDFGEESDPKGFCWVELQRGATQWEFVRVDARPMVTLRIDCLKDANPTRTVVTEIRRHHLQDAIVRVIVSLTAETNSAFDDTPVREALKMAGVFHLAGITRDIERSRRNRLGNSPEGLDPHELLEQYLINQNVEPEARSVLMEAAKGIFNPQE
jgi:exonuclease SbcD